MLLLRRVSFFQVKGLAPVFLVGSVTLLSHLTAPCPVALEKNLPLLLTNVKPANQFPLKRQQLGEPCRLAPVKETNNTLKKQELESRK